MTDNNAVHLFKANQFIVKDKGCPKYFIGIIERETPKAFKISGKGVMLKKKMGICSLCGKKLTNANSIVLGIGPICAVNNGIDILSGFTDKDIEKELHKININSWFPKSCIKIQDVKNVDSMPVFEKGNETPTKDEKTPEIEKKATKKGDKLVITFPFDPQTLIQVKSLSGRRYQKEPSPHWICPDTIENRTELNSYGFNIPDSEKIEEPNNSEKKNKMVTKFPSHLDKVLFPYQKEGVQFLFNNDGRALIGDEQGLGKTLESITYSIMDTEVKKILIICPASLKLNWAKEYDLWASDFNLWILQGKPNSVQKKAKIGLSDLNKFQIVSNKTAKRDIVIINWDIIGNKQTKVKGKKKPVEHLYTGWVDYLIDMNFDLIIADEIHFAKNPQAQRTKALQKIGKRVQKFIPMSGTPIVNRPIEFWTCLNLLNSGIFNSYWNYAKKYCGARHNGYGWDFSGNSNTKQLNEILKTVMIRRLKKDVLKELPDKIHSVVPMEINNRKEYQFAEDNLISYLKETQGQKAADKAEQAETLVKIEKLKQLTVKGKINSCINWIKDYLESNDKLVVFCHHKETIKTLESNFKKISVTVDGSTKNEDRQKAVDLFQNNPNTRLFFGNIKAAGTGLTLTEANGLAFIEFGWTPGEVDQCSDRIHRIGQKADCVNIYYLVGDKTIDIDIMEMLDEKRKVLDAVLDGKKEESISLVNMLLEKRGEK